ncbi:MAG TPA: multidrug efflux SMR transporter [Humisphaera sp.]
MAWMVLLLAGLFEVAWAFGLKRYGFTWSWGTAATLVGMLLSFSLLSVAMKSLPLGTAYVIWTGIGAVGAAIVGMAVLGEPRDLGRVACIIAIAAGIIGLKALAPAETTTDPAPTDAVGRVSP